MKLSDFLVDLGNAVAYYPRLVDVTGGVLPNLFLCQMYYWLGKQKNPEGWIYKSQAEIERETGLTRKEQETARKSLKARGLLKEKFVGCPRRVEFWLDKDALNQRWLAFMNNLELPIEEITKAWTRKSKKDDSASLPTKRILPEKDNIDSPNSAICNASTEQYILPEKDYTECPVWTGSNAPSGHTVMPHLDITSIYTKNTSEITTQNAPPKPGAPPAQECVCEEKLELTSPQNQVQTTPQSSTSLLNKSESLPQTENPSSGSNIPVGLFGKVEQANKRVQIKFQSVEDLLNQVLLDPSIMASESLPAVYKNEIRLRSWRFPWRTLTRDKVYQTCDRRLVELIAKERAEWDKTNWQQKIPTVLKSIGLSENSKVGLEQLMGYWSRIVEPDAASTTLTQAENEPIGYYSNRSLDWHKGTFNELLDLADRVGQENAIAQFTTRYDQQHTGATANWLNWLEANHPQMYSYLHQQAA
ncbi:hypothetical protein NIES2111_64240 (plasmid) [Nostoc sp. NIES-2111]|nr:hypothetical protein NIES2111_64240 [Nostoc sp. NIES-2111]